MKLKLQLPLLAAVLLPFTYSSAATVAFSVDESQTVDSAGTFPGAGSNNLSKFTTAGGGAFDTTDYIRGSSSDALRRVRLFIQFDLTGLTGDTITSAELKFDGYSLNDINSGTISVSQVTNDWAPGGTPDPTYSPATTNAVTQALNIGAGGPGTAASYTFDVTTIAQNWQGGDTNNGFFIELTSDTIDNGLGMNNFSLDVTSVPEPSSAALLGLGSLALILRRRSN